MVFSEEIDNKNIDGIYIYPPEPNVLTDEDSADDDDGGLVDNVSKRQLLANAEFHFANDNLTADDNNNDREEAALEDIEEISMLEKNKFLMNLIGTKYNNRTWIDGDLIQTSTFPNNNMEDYKNFFPSKLFELFFDGDVLSHIINQSRKYALYLNCPDPAISIEELKCFLGIQL